MIKEPETYEELIRYKRCVDLTKYYQLFEDDIKLIYDYLTQYPEAVITGNETTLTLRPKRVSNENVQVINTICTDSSIDGVTLGNRVFSVIPHYIPSSGGGGGGYSGGSSGNNNNNNNNNNR